MKAKLITKTQLKSALKNHSSKELINLIGEMSHLSERVSEFLTMRFAPEQNLEILQSYKGRIKNEFFSSKGKNSLNLSVAKKAISDYKKISGDHIGTIDLMLYYVEMGNEFTNKYGDINSNYYTSLELVFEKIVDAINEEETDAMYKIFAERIDRLIENAFEGWGFFDTLQELYFEIDWLEHDE